MFGMSCHTVIIKNKLGLVYGNETHTHTLYKIANVMDLEAKY